MLYYVRHGETVWNRERRLQGRQDSPLTSWGTELAGDYGGRLADELADQPNVQIAASPMDRALATAAIIAEALGVDAKLTTVDDRLAEHDVGEWSGKTWAEVISDDGRSRDELAGWDVRPPGGETRREVQGRACSWLAQPRTSAVTIVVGHGAYSRMFRGAYLGLTEGETAALSSHSHGRFYRLVDGNCETIAVT